MKNRYSNILVALIILLQISVSAQDKVTLSGYVKDLNSGETLIGAAVFVKELSNGATTNEYGFYSISIEPGAYTIEYSYLGFDSEIIQLTLDANVKRDVELGPAGLEIEEVVISAEAENANVSDVEMSVNKLDITAIKKMPSFLGEVEILRSIQLLPGVSSVGEGATGFNVRGGSIDQNLVLLDEAPVYNSSHLFGFFSVFNPDAVKDVKLYKGGIPSRYGGRLSSILDVRMKEGNSKKFTAQGGIGAIFSRLSLEAPLSDKGSFIVAGRRSYADVLAAPFLNDDLSGSVLNFYDLTAKANYNINDKNRIYLSAYTGRDNFGFGDQAGFNWGNQTLTFRWNHLFSEKLFSNFTVYASDYDYKLNFGDDSTNSFDWDASIVNYSFKPEFSFFITPKSTLRFGGQSIIYRFEPGNAIGVSENEVLDLSIDDKYSIETALFVENEINFTPALTVNYGLRWSHFNYTGEGESYEFGDATSPGRRRPVISSESFDQWESIQTYSNFEPRLSAKLQLGESKSIKASYNRMVQYIHLISNTAASTPVDIWTPSTNNIKPQIADQIALGYFQNFSDNKYELTAEVYYKKYENLVDYIDGADILLNELLEGDLLAGDGRAYGLELMFKKTEGKFNGWVSYTLARSERKVEGISNGDWYPSRFDQTHNFSLTSFYDLNKRWSFSANFALISGTPISFPTTRFEQQGFVIPYNVSGERNNFRIPIYHRLDVSATLQGKKNPDRRWQSEWVFSIYNLYSKRNPFNIYFRQGEGITTEAVRLSVIGNFIPSVSYNFKF